MRILLQTVQTAAEHPLLFDKAAAVDVTSNVGTPTQTLVLRTGPVRNFWKTDIFDAIGTRLEFGTDIYVLIANAISAATNTKLKSQNTIQFF